MILLPLFPLLLLFLSISCRDTSAAKVYLHVGPHRTGCTHIQNFALTHKNLIEDGGFCFPFGIKPTKETKGKKKKKSEIEKRKSIKGINDPLHRLFAHENDTKFFELVSPCIAQDKNVFITSELISSFSLNLLNVLKSAFPASYDFHVILTYREWLTRMYSQYTEQTKRTILGAGPISEYVFHNYGQIGRTAFNYTFLIETFSEAFQYDHIHLLDYYGIESAGKDITFALFCDIMKIPGFCNSTSPAINLPRPNTKTEAHYIHLISLLRNYIFNKGYEFDHVLMKKKSFANQFTKDLMVAFHNERVLKKLPLKRSNLKLLHSYALENDEDFRSHYANKLLYNNVTATLDAINSMEATEIDIAKFYQDPKFNTFLESEFQRLLRDGIVVPKKFD
jgi:hypothetical protein